MKPPKKAKTPRYKGNTTAAVAPASSPRFKGNSNASVAPKKKK